MDSGFIALLAVVTFLGLLATGHAAITRGANRDVATGVVMVAVGVMFGIVALAALAPLL